MTAVANYPSVSNHTVEFTPNRYSVLYTLKGQHQHVPCSSEEEAQHVLGLLITDGNRNPIGIYDSKADVFDWEIVGAYFHSQCDAEEQQLRENEVLNITRALRRRDASWMPGLMRKPGLFA